MRSRSSLLVPLLAVVGSASVAAAPAASTDRGQAQKLVTRGAGAFDKGDFAEALVNFRAAYELFPSPRVLYDLGLCHLRLEHSIEAATAFQKYVDAAQTEPTLPNVDKARAQLEGLIAKLARLNLELDPPETQAMVDGAAVKSGVIYLSPGDHTLIWTAPGASTSTKKLTLAAGAETRLTIRPEAEKPKPPDLPAWQPGPAGDLAVETSAFLKQSAYRNPAHYGTEGSDGGAFGKANETWERAREGKWVIDPQREAYEAIAAGIAYERQDLIDRGRKMVDWGLARQQTDGGFDCPDALHGTAAFIEAAAHAALLLDASPQRAANHAWVESIAPRVARAAHWLIEPRNEKVLLQRDRPYTQRAYLDAAAVGEAGVLAGDPELVDRSWTYARAGLAAQDPSGFNPEKGHGEPSGQVTGLMYALTYDELVATAKQREALAPMIRSGFVWLKGRVRSDGTVDTSVPAPKGKAAAEKPKAMAYREGYRAAFAWAAMTKDGQWADLARQLVDGELAERKARAAAKAGAATTSE
jgi:hypothetical protein